MRDAISLMLDHKIGCLPVTDEGGILLGILTDSDLLRVADQRAEDRDRQDLAAQYND